MKEIDVSEYSLPLSALGGTVIQSLGKLVTGPEWRAFWSNDLVSLISGWKSHMLCVCVRAWFGPCDLCSAVFHSACSRTRIQSGSGQPSDSGVAIFQ